VIERPTSSQMAWMIASAPRSAASMRMSVRAPSSEGSVSGLVAREVPSTSATIS